MGQAQRLPTGEELRGYYEAALAFIDPRLPLEASLDEIVASASQRQAGLARRPLDSVRTDLQELAEALLFVQRTHPQVKSALIAAHTVAPARSASGHQASSEPPAVKLLFEADHSTPPPEHRIRPTAQARPAAAASTRRGTPASRSTAGDVVGSTALKPQQQLRPEPLELPLPAPVEPMRLPEDRAWPMVAGLLLMAWQAWLAGFSGWAVARCIAWPAPGYGLDMPWPALAGVIVLGATVGAGMLLLTRAYRVVTHRLGLLVHLSGLAVLADVLAWWLAARRWPGLVQYPGWGSVAIVAVVWLAAWGAATWYDACVLAARRAQRAAAKQRRATPV